MGIPQSFLEGRTKHSGEEIQGQIEKQGLKNRSFRDCLTGDPHHMQPPYPITIADAKKCLLAETRYGCLMRASARFIQKYLGT